MLTAGLERFVQVIARTAEVKKSLSDAIRAVRQLYQTGAEIGFALFKNDIGGVQSFFNRACPTWRLAGNEAYVPPWVELVGPLELLPPLEFVPLLDTSEPDPHDHGGLVETAARFLSFSTVFTRTASDRTFSLTDDAIVNSPALLIRLFRNAELAAAADEEDFFRAEAGAQLRGPWPARVLEHREFVDGLARQLYDARSPDDAVIAGEVPADHVQHFVCHCDTEKQESRDYSMTLAHRAPGFLSFLRTPAQVTATLAELGAKFFSLQPRKTDAHPLIFLNACGASKVTAVGVASFPGVFLDIGNRGVIGTETAVPDRAGAAFARIFYRRFLQGDSLGEALYRARVEMLHDWQNPVGFLYSAYANPNLHLRLPQRSSRSGLTPVGARVVRV